MKCEYCGAYISRKQKFCMQCGEQVIHKKITVKSRAIPSWIVRFFIVAVCLVLVGCTFCHLKSYHNNDVFEAAVKQTYISDTNNLEDEKYLPALIERLITQNVSFIVVKHQKDFVTLKITAPNMYELYSQIILPSDTPPNDPAVLTQIDEYIRTALQSGAYSMVTNTVTVRVKEVDEEIEIIPTFEYIDAIYGNMLSYYQEITE